MIFGLFLFLFFYHFICFKEKKIFKNCGWLYFISHYQLFLIGFIFLFASFFLLIRGVVFSLFFLDSNFFILALLFFFIAFPFSLDCLSYGLFNSSFFLEKFEYRGKNLMGVRRILVYNFINSYIRCLYLFISLFFFVLFYFLLVAFHAFIFWCLLYSKSFEYFYSFILSDYILFIASFFIFMFPFMIEIFSYAFFNSSFFNSYIDY